MITKKEKNIKMNFLNRLQGSLFYPGKFFSNIKEKSPYQSVIFFVIVMLIFTFISFIFDGINGEFSGLPVMSSFSLAVLFVMILVIMMILGVIVLYLKTLLLYVFILLFKIELSFDKTLILRSYTSSPLVFAWIPIIGIPLSFIWSIVIEIIGLSIYAKISVLKSAMVILLPLLIVILIIFLIFLFALSIILNSPAGFLIKDLV